MHQYYLVEGDSYIKMECYILFMGQIPSKFWSDKPILYQINMKWDALGFLGERLHKTELNSKYLQLCFAQCGINILHILDDESERFRKYRSNKERFLAALHYVEGKLSEKDLITLYARAKGLCNNNF